MRVYRLTTRDEPDEAFSGEGSRRVAGRWHPKGVAVVYTSSSIALALVENLVHMDADALGVFRHLFAVDVPDRKIEIPPLSSLPTDWSHPRRSDSARAFGHDWARSKASLALGVPSVVVPGERNVLLNPAHPEFAALPFSGPTPFSFDARLIKTAPSARAALRPRRRQ